MPKRIFEGTIISDKMQNTVVVKVTQIKQHIKYKKRYRVHAKYKAHVVTDGFLVGDKVIIEECRPISKDKTWRVIKKISEGTHNIIDEIHVTAPKLEKLEEEKEVKQEKE